MPCFLFEGGGGGVFGMPASAAIACRLVLPLRSLVCMGMCAINEGVSWELPLPVACLSGSLLSTSSSFIRRPWNP
jgi:hypothetical protein